ncbi:MAG: RHS repeat-associated core domain-containing protein, partial [Sinomicrobium sp.]|nr:RHS repeat-associated core domain-containing protein [Sinomicrobium sp.]
LKQKSIQYYKHPYLLNYILWSVFVLCCLGYSVSFLRFCRTHNFRIKRGAGWSPVAFSTFIFMVIFGINPAAAHTGDPQKNIPGVPEVGTLFFHQDPSHSTGLTTDKNGNESSRTHYTPYGNIYEQSGTDNFRAKYGGKELEKGAGLYYFNARYYDPGLGRFISADTELGGSYLQPDAFNRYAYALNNPVNYSDPSGHIAEPLIGVGGATAATLPEAWAAYTAATGIEVASEAAAISGASAAAAPETLGISLIVGLIVTAIVITATVIITAAVTVGSILLANAAAGMAVHTSAVASPAIARAAKTHGTSGGSNTQVVTYTGGGSNGSKLGNNSDTGNGNHSTGGLNSGGGGGGDKPPNNNKLKSSHEDDYIYIPKEILELIGEFFSDNSSLLNFSLTNKSIFKTQIKNLKEREIKNYMLQSES